MIFYMLKTNNFAESLALKNRKFIEKGFPILKENRKSIQILFPKLGNSFKKVFPISEMGKIGNLIGSPDCNKQRI